MAVITSLLAELRLARGWQILQIAEVTDTQPAAIRRWDRADVERLRPSDRWAIREILGVEPVAGQPANSQAANVAHG